MRARKGLLVLVLSLQESERAANQLKGRSGRQGDPGETYTLVSMHDPSITLAGLSEGMRVMAPYLESEYPREHEEGPILPN